MAGSRIAFRPSLEPFVFLANQDGIKLNHKDKAIVTGVKQISDPYIDRKLFLIYFNPLVGCTSMWSKRFKVSYSVTKDLINSKVSCSLTLLLNDLEAYVLDHSTYKLFKKLRVSQAKIAIELTQLFTQQYEYFRRLALCQDKLKKFGVKEIFKVEFCQYIAGNDLPKQIDLEFFRYLTNGKKLDAKINEYWNAILKEPQVGCNQHILVLNSIYALKNKMLAFVQEQILVSFHCFARLDDFIDLCQTELAELCDEEMDKIRPTLRIVTYIEREKLKTPRGAMMAAKANYHYILLKELSPFWRKEIVRKAIEELLQTIKHDDQLFLDTLERTYNKNEDTVKKLKKNGELEEVEMLKNLLEKMPDSKKKRKVKIDRVIYKLEQAFPSARTDQEEAVLRYWENNFGTCFHDKLTALRANYDYSIEDENMLNFIANKISGSATVLTLF